MTSFCRSLHSRPNATTCSWCNSYVGLLRERLRTCWLPHIFGKYARHKSNGSSSDELQCICTSICDWACKNRACGLLKFDYFSNFGSCNFLFQCDTATKISRFVDNLFCITTLLTENPNTPFQHWDNYVSSNDMVCFSPHALFSQARSHMTLTSEKEREILFLEGLLQHCTKFVKHGWIFITRVHATAVIVKWLSYHRFHCHIV